MGQKVCDEQFNVLLGAITSTIDKYISFTAQQLENIATII